MKETTRSNIPPSIDRLSGLPDEVIGHILSFLSTKSFVRTSILAKQWRFLWTRVSVLGFIVDEPKMIKKFHNTIDDEFKSWIDTVYARNVRNIVIRLNYQLTLPPCLFSCNTLVDLCIIDSGYIRVEATVYFPALKKLQLVNVGYDTEESLNHLIFGCPVLEELIIDKVMLNYSLPITRNANKSLAATDYKPTLRYLFLRASEIPYLEARELLIYLVEAVVDLSEVQFSSSCLVRDFLGKLLLVKRLTLSSRRLEISNKSFFRGSFYFPHLTELNLCADWRFIILFFECAENLRVLTIRSTADHNTQCYMEPLRMFAYPLLMDHLERVNLVDFQWSSNEEFEMVKYVLKNASALKMMEIIYTTQYYEEFDWNKKVEALNRLASFEMGSTCIRLRYV